MTQERTEQQRKLASIIGAMLQPPERMKLSDWSEKYVKLPPGMAVRPGELKHWPYMREILDCIGDPEYERVTVKKSARLGYTKGLMFAIAGVAAMDPSSIILLVPTDDDARRFAVEEIEPVFEASPALRKLIKQGRNDGRNTLLRRSLLGGGSIKVLSARAPRQLRAHDAKILLVDEADAMEITAEGDPVRIAEGRTFAHADRKIVIGSTPTEEGISVVERNYEESDQRIFEVPCPKCGVYAEIVWENIRWPSDESGYRTDLTYYHCPHCNEHIDERYKPQMVYAGRWRITRPDVKGHAGFQINALSSLLPNASWSKLAAEWLKAKRGGPSEIQPFVNLVLGRSYRTSVHKVDAGILAERAEPWGAPVPGVRPAMVIPRDVLMLTVGADVQDDRIEAVLMGWPIEGAPFILGRFIFDGNTLDPEVWSAFDKWTMSTWRNERGWRMGIDAVAVDSGGREGRTQVVYDFCAPRVHRRIFAIKGISGFGKRVWARATKVKGNARLFNIAVDVVKTEVMDAMAREPFPEGKDHDPQAMRFSDALDDEFFDQATGEVRRLKYKKNRPVIEWEPKRVGQRVESFDCLVYGWAVRLSPSLASINLKERAAREPEPEDAPVQRKKRSAGDWAAALNS